MAVRAAGLPKSTSVASCSSSPASRLGGLIDHGEDRPPTARSSAKASAPWSSPAATLPAKRSATPCSSVTSLPEPSRRTSSGGTPPPARRSSPPPPRRRRRRRLRYGLRPTPTEVPPTWSSSPPRTSPASRSRAFACWPGPARPPRQLDRRPVNPDEERPAP